MKNGRVSVLENVPSEKKKPKTKAERDDDQLAITLAKLEIDAEALASAPGLTEILKDANGGIPSVIAAMRFSQDSGIREFLKTYDEASVSDRKLLPLEAFALLADVDIPQLLGQIIIALRNQSANIVKIIATTAHPSVTRASIKNAMKPGGYRDRNALHTAMRFLPVSKGATILIPQIGALPGGGAIELEPGEVDTNDLFPDLAETQKMLTSGD